MTDRIFHFKDDFNDPAGSLVELIGAFINCGGCDGRTLRDEINHWFELRAVTTSISELYWLRRWFKNDEEPPVGMDRFRDVDGNLIGRDSAGNWLYLTVDGKPQDDSCSVPWSDLDDEYDVGWPLSPVAPSAEVAR